MRPACIFQSLPLYLSRLLREEPGVKQRLKRIFARITLFIIAVLLCLLLYFAFTGAPPEVLLAILFCLIVVPAVAYVFLWITELIRKDR